MKFHPEMQIAKFKDVKPGNIVSVPGANDSLTLGITVESHEGFEFPDLIVLPSSGADKSEEFHVMAGHVFIDDPILVYYDPLVKIDTSLKGAHLQKGSTRSEGYIYLFEKRLAICAEAPQISRTAKPLFWLDTGTRLTDSLMPNAMFAQWSILVPAEAGEHMTLLKVRQP